MTSSFNTRLAVPVSYKAHYILYFTERSLHRDLDIIHKIKENINQSKELLDLNSNWDGEGARKISKKAFDSMKK